MGVEGLLEGFYEQIVYEDIGKDLSGYKGIVFCGMGGSGIAGTFASKWLNHRGVKIPSFVVKGYELPPFVDDSYLVVCISYSGNTEETLSNFEEALKRGIKPVCITSGGKLKELAEKNGCEVYEVPKGFQPRYAFGYLLSKALCLVGISPEEMEDAKENVRENLNKIKEEGYRIAERLYGYVPVVYSTPLTDAIAERWKGQINENAKTPLYYAVLPEMHHNEVMGWNNPSLRNKFHYIVMYDAKDHHRVKLRVDITLKLLKDMGIVPIVLKGEGNSYLSRSLYLVHLADWVSVKLAELYGYDSLKVDTIERIKEELKKYD
ncbi:bifunctional phosphoglucose/phosphomannose isomerase [Aquifex pyrophilus]